jgi:glycosyltransferase involved in cell wall biosynthesis
MGAVTPVRVTAVVCGDDRDGVDRALAAVRAQTRPPEEILVVERNGSLGAARARALSQARGDLVAWCDAGEEWLPEHLAILAGELERRPGVDLVYGDAEVVDANGGPRLQPAEDYDFFRLSWFGVGPRGGQVVHRASAAHHAGGFDSGLRRHADLDLWLRMCRRGLLRRVPEVVTRRHEGGEDPEWEEWALVMDRNYEQLAYADPADSHDLLVDAAAPAGFDPATWCESGRELIVCATPVQGTGYGEVTRALLQALPGAGVTPILAPTRAQLDSELEPFERAFDHWGRWAFYYHVITQPRALPSARRAAYSMWESTVVPAERIEELNAGAELVFVPCVQNAEAFVSCGLERPVGVLHHGVDPARFPVLERAQDCRPFTFGSFGDLSPRKGIDALVRAFRAEFGEHEDVALRLRSSKTPPDAEGLDDARIHVEHGICDHPRLLEALRSMDAFVQPSRGEGFGLCGLEAAATGLPVIATDWSGPAEYVREVHGLPLRYQLQDAAGRRIGSSVFEGLWAEPDVDHLRELMRSLYEDRDAARERGRMAAQAVRERWTWERPAKQIRDELDARTLT